MEPNHKKTLLIASGAGVLFIMACIGLLILTAGGLALSKRSTRNQQSSTLSERASRVLHENLTPTNAQLQDLRGWVEIQSDRGDWSGALSGQTLTAGQHVRTGDLSGVTLAFYDGSLAVLPSNSEIAIDELNAPAGDQARTILLTQVYGESTHTVAPNTQSQSQYLVKSPSGEGEAKGTVFNVIVMPDQTAYYSVIEGVVAVTSMQVTVLVNAGEFTTLFFEQPPLTPVISVSGEGKLTQTGETWIIADQAFRVNESTIISGNPQLGDWVQVKGHLAEDGAAVADWIFLLHASPVNRFSMNGNIEAIAEGLWTINGLAVVVTEDTELDDGLQTGELVRVDGLILEDGKLQASEIRRVEDQESLPFRFTGVIEEISEDLWMISGVTLLVTDQTALDEDLEAGDVVHVTGRIEENGDWRATSIVLAEDESRKFSFTGTLEQIDPWKVAGIAFEVGDYTLLDEGLAVGMQVRVEGQIDAQGVWVASRVERLEDEEASTMILIGTVISIDPWIVSGIPLTISETTLIDEDIVVGMLVRVEIHLGAEGTWQVISIRSIDQVAWFPGCIDIVAKVVSISGNQIQVLNWPALTIAEGAQIEGEITPNSLIRFRICFTEGNVILVNYIVILVPGEIEVEVPDQTGDKVMVCHKPDKKKGGHTLTISRSALGAHLGHGDYEGACR